VSENAKDIDDAAEVIGDAFARVAAKLGCRA